MKNICSDEIINVKIRNFFKSSKRRSPRSQPRATSSPPIVDSFMYIETSRNISCSKSAFVSFKCTDIIQMSNITFYHERFSISTNNSLPSLSRFKIQLLLADNIWSTAYNIPKNDRYSDSSTDWTLLSLNFPVKNYDFKLKYDQIDTPHSDMCFSNNT